MTVSTSTCGADAGIGSIGRKAGVEPTHHTLDKHHDGRYRMAARQRTRRASAPAGDDVTRRQDAPPPPSPSPLASPADDPRDPPRSAAAATAGAIASDVADDARRCCCCSCCCGRSRSLRAGGHVRVSAQRNKGCTFSSTAP